MRKRPGAESTLLANTFNFSRHNEFVSRDRDEVPALERTVAVVL